MLCLQETRCPDSRLPVDDLRELGYEIAYSSGERQHRGGVAIITRAGLTAGKVDFELHGGRELAAGRWLSMPVEDLTLCSVYVPAGSVGEEINNAEKLRFLKELAAHVQERRSEKFLIVGDFNIAPEDQDVYEPLWLKGAYKIDEPERSHLREILRVGELVDVYRHLHPDDSGYTMWQEREGHYARDYGLRIDLALASESILERLHEATVNHLYRQGSKPSDHAPLFLSIARSTAGESAGAAPARSKTRRLHEPMPQQISPMLATASRLPPRTSEWAIEIKWDGIRAISYWQLGELRIESRNHRDLTAQYPELEGLGKQLGSCEAILDGEIVALDERGLPSFTQLQQRMHLTNRDLIDRRAAEVPVTYVIFDLLYLKDRVTMNLSYLERRELLQELELNGDAWQTPDFYTGDSSGFLDASARYGLEGIIAKRLKSIYVPGRRTEDWLKVKNIGRQEFLVGGWLSSKGAPGQIGALLLGYYERLPGAGEVLRYAGRVGSGLDDRQRRELSKRLAALACKESPFTGVQPPGDALFVRPRVIVEVQFSNWTRDRMLRHPVYKGLRTDLSPREIVLEISPSDLTDPEPQRPTATPAAHSRLDPNGAEDSGKVIYPEIEFTHEEVVDYYRAIAEVTVAHLAGRSVIIDRYPEGVKGPRASRAHDSIDDAQALLGYVADDAIEFYAALASRPDPGTPRAMVFILKQGEHTDMRECARVALWVNELLLAVGLHAIVKTSGSGDLEVYVPLNTPTGYEQTSLFARAIAELVERQHPEHVICAEPAQADRRKVLIDWRMNDPSRMCICVYSLRALDRPTVSTPLRWEEVQRAAPNTHEVQLDAEPPVILERIDQSGDLFIPYLALKQDLPEIPDSPAS